MRRPPNPPRHDTSNWDCTRGIQFPNGRLGRSGHPKRMIDVDRKATLRCSIRESPGLVVLAMTLF
jgi:hypothetical protein